MPSHLSALSSIDAELAKRLLSDRAFRNRYIRFWAQNEVATELRSLRKRRDKKQSEVAQLAGTGQSAISRIERADYDGWTYKTLLAIAEALHARLSITFEPIEDVAARIASADGGSPFVVIGGVASPDPLPDDTRSTSDNVTVWAVAGQQGSAEKYIENSMTEV